MRRICKAIANVRQIRNLGGIEILPIACRVMAKRLRDVCGLPESEPLWRAGRGFVVHP
jgi:hypothetical protein